MHRRVVLLAVVALVLATTVPAPAAPVTPYVAKAFAEAQNAGKSIVVFVHAPW
jgi:hypothetical protein